LEENRRVVYIRRNNKREKLLNRTEEREEWERKKKQIEVETQKKRQFNESNNAFFKQRHGKMSLITNYHNKLK
jgi:hypothetical protein